LKTDIKFEYRFGMYKTLLRMTLYLILFISVKNTTGPFSDIVKMKSLLVKSLVFSRLYGIYNMYSILFAKQWLLASKVRILFSTFVLAQNTISSSDSYILDIYFPIPLLIFCLNIFTRAKDRYNCYIRNKTWE